MNSNVLQKMNVDEARDILFKRGRKRYPADMARIIRQIETEAREEGEKRARKLISDSIRDRHGQCGRIHHLAGAPAQRGNEGTYRRPQCRNIRAFEQAAGVDVIVDDTPEAVTISCFETGAAGSGAACALQADPGRTHPSRSHRKGSGR